MNEHSNNDTAGNPSIREVPAAMIRENDDDDDDDDDNGMMIDLKRNKRRKKDKVVLTISTNEETTATCSSMSNPSLLLFPSNNDGILVPVILSIASYLVTREVLNCIQTCQVWNTNFDTGAVWCEAAKNASSPFVVGAIQTAARTRAHEVDDNYALRNRQIALAVSTTGETDFRGFKDDKEVGGEPQSKLQLEDYLLVMEIRDGVTKKHVVTCCRDLSELDEPRMNKRWGGKIRQLRIAPPIHDSQQERFTTIVVPTDDLPFLMGEQVYRDDADVDDDDDDDEFYDFRPIFAHWELTSRLIRCDTGTSVCINNTDSVLDFRDGINQTCCFGTTVMKPNADNLAGIIASGICYRHEYNFVEFDYVIPLQQMSKYEFTIKKIEMNLRVCVGDDECPNDDFKSSNHLLLWLEGLDWK